MGTAGIGAVTAFVVVNAARFAPQVPTLVAWVVPGVVGGLWLTWVQARLSRAR
jgi:hypothetical protein